MSLTIFLFCFFLIHPIFAINQSHVQSQIKKREPRIGIIGAGASGITTAWHLVQNNYTDITIFEKTRNPGGYVKSVRYKNVTHDLGAYAFTSSFWRLIQTVTKQLGIPLCSFKVSVAAPGNNSRAGFTQDPLKYIGEISAKSLPNPEQYPVLVKQQMQKYFQLWSQLFQIPFMNDHYQSLDLFPNKPKDQSVINSLAKPATEFLKENGLELLIPIFRAFLDTQAYGPLDETAILYVMAWITPGVLLPNTEAKIPCTPFGMQDILKRMLTKMSGKVKVMYDTPVVYVKRNQNTAQIVTNGNIYNYFDKVIVAVPLQKAFVRPSLARENQAISSFEELEIFSTFLEGKRKTVFAKDLFALLHPKFMINPSNTQGIYTVHSHEAVDVGGPFYSDRNFFARNTAVYFYNERRFRLPVSLNEKQKRSIVLTAMKYFDDTEWSVISTNKFKKYFQRWKPEDVKKGMPWIFDEIQGNGNVYYVSSYSAGFESIGHIFDYSRRLVDRHFKKMRSGMRSKNDISI